MQEQQQEIRLLVMLALMGQLYSFLRSMEECIVTMVPELNSRLTNPEFGMSKTYRMYFRIFLGYRILSKLSTFYIDSTTHHIPIYTMLPLRQYNRLLMTDVKTSMIHGPFSKIRPCNGPLCVIAKMQEVYDCLSVPKFIWQGFFDIRYFLGQMIDSFLATWGIDCIARPESMKVHQQFLLLHCNGWIFSHHSLSVA